MKNNRFSLHILPVFIAVLLLLPLSGCSGNGSDPRFEEAERALESLEQSRPENAGTYPDFTGEITDIHMTILDREYYAPSFEADFQNLSMMQILYGYCSDGVWHDYPSENYNLIGILGHEDHTGWRAALGSHMVKIGPYLLINICIQNHPTKECIISDTLGSQTLEPFAQYNTYHFYFDENGEKQYFMDSHNHGYGYIAENPTLAENSEDVAYIKNCEFMRRIYLILDYELISSDYELTVTITRGNATEEVYSLTGEAIKDLVG